MVEAFILGYFFIILLSLLRKKKTLPHGNVDFLLAGRKLSLLPFVATLVTTSYGWISGIGEIYYDYGISAWLFLSLPYTLFGIVVAFFFTKRFRMEEVNSIPELLDKKYGSKVARFGTLFVLLFVSPAMYILMGAQVIEHVFDWNILICIALIIVFSSIYLYRGGFGSLIRNDSIKFLLMFGGFAVVFFTLVSDYSSEFQEAIPASKLEFSLSAHWMEILSWFVMASIVLADPAYHQRIYASESPATAKKGILLSILCWTVFDFLAGGTAIYAIALLPENADTSTIYLQLGDQFLSPFINGLFYLGILSTILSTADSFLFLSAQSLSIDLLRLKGSTERKMKIGLASMSLLSFLLLLYYQDKSAVNIFLDFTPYIVSALVAPVIFSFHPKFRLQENEVLLQMSLSVLVCLLFSLWPQELFGEKLNPVIPGLLFSFFFPPLLRLVRVKAD